MEKAIWQMENADKVGRERRSDEFDVMQNRTISAGEADESLWIDARINREGGWVIDRYGEEWWMRTLEIYRFLPHTGLWGVNPMSARTA